MAPYSTNEAAAKLGISGKALSRYIQLGKVPPPQIIETGKAILHVWSDEDVEHLRRLLPKIANGRKTRYQKSKKENGKTPGRPPVPRKKQTKKK